MNDEPKNLSFGAEKELKNKMKAVLSDYNRHYNLQFFVQIRKYQKE